MSETPYERIEKDGKIEWLRVWETTGNKSSATYPELLEWAFQLGLQSRPAPTPGLLLTDEEIIAIPGTFTISAGKAVAQAQLSHAEPLIRADERRKIIQFLKDWGAGDIADGLMIAVFEKKYGSTENLNLVQVLEKFLSLKSGKPIEEAG